MAYAPASGEEVIFSNQSADYSPTSIALRNRDEYFFSPLTCTDIPAFKRYLAGLTLCHITGMYDPRGDCLLVTMDNSLSVTLYEHLVTVEEHSVLGGLYSATAEAVCRQRFHKPVIPIGINDLFVRAGSYSYQLSQSGLTGEQIKARILEIKAN